MIWLTSTRWSGKRNQAATGNSQNAISSGFQRSLGRRGAVPAALSGARVGAAMASSGVVMPSS